MKEIRGERLYVNLSASQVRRRLKGHGFGVRKVGSDGFGQTVIIHTATGQHRRDLEALFQDSLVRQEKAEDSGEEGVEE